MFFRIFFAFTLFVHMVSFPVFAMGVEEETTSFHPSFQLALDQMSDSEIQKKILMPHVKKSLYFLQQVFLRDSIYNTLEPQVLSQYSEFSKPLIDLLDLDENLSQVIQAQLEEQERISPIVTLSQFKNRIEHLKKYFNSLLMTQPHSALSKFHFLYAPHIDSFVRLSAYSRSLTSDLQSFCHIFDVHGVLTVEGDPQSSFTRTPRGHICNFVTYLHALQAPMIAASAYADFSTVISDLVTLRMAPCFGIQRKDNDSNEDSSEDSDEDWDEEESYERSIIETNDCMTQTPRRYQTRYKGHVASARWVDWKSGPHVHDPHFRQKGFTSDIVFPGRKFDVLLFVDDSFPNNSCWFMESLISSKSYEYAQHVVIVDLSPSIPKEDLISSQTSVLVEKAFGGKLDL
ncbi:MAG: hypothetical protein JSR85_00310 [Proteobacteria bacterium]|nr:hypothetical protein [Pseudomonadota bacterium]